MTGTDLVPTRQPHALTRSPAMLPALFLPNEKAAERFLEFFTAHIANKNTRRAYYKTACHFAHWCEGRGLTSLAEVKPLHVSAYIEELKAELATPSVKRALAALRMLFDWLVVGHVLGVNPAHAVRGPKYSIRKGKTPILERDEARALLASIDTGTLTGLRDRALIATMVYTFARIDAVLQMNVRDYFSQGRHGWMRLHEKGGKELDAACHHKLEIYLDEYLAASGGTDDLDRPLFLSTGRKTGIPQRLAQSDAYLMIKRRAKHAGIKTKIGNHSMRGTGITAYLGNGGRLEGAQAMANHASPRTTKLYDRTSDAVSREEYERVGI